jgi:hypothetical protein
LRLLRERVTSSVIESIGYDDVTNMLEVEFRTGRVYQYLDVPPDLYRDLMNAESIGEFFNRTIRTYPYNDVTEGGP